MPKTTTTNIKRLISCYTYAEFEEKIRELKITYSEAIMLPLADKDHKIRRHIMKQLGKTPRSLLIGPFGLDERKYLQTGEESDLLP